MPAKKVAAKVPPRKRAPRKPKEETPSEPILTVRPVRIEKKTYNLPQDSTCAVCMHPARVKIEVEILLGTFYNTIEKMFSNKEYVSVTGDIEHWPKVTRKQVSAHYNADHSPLDAYLMKDLQDQAAEEQGIEYAEFGSRVVNELVFARLVISEVQKDILTGKQKPTVREGIAASRIVQVSQQAAAGGDEPISQTWYYEQAFEVFMDEARKIMSQANWLSFTKTLGEHPVLRTLIEQRKKQIANQQGDVA